MLAAATWTHQQARQFLIALLVVEAAQAAARIHPDWRRRYMHLAMRRHKSIAKDSDGAQAGGSVVLDVARWL